MDNVNPVFNVNVKGAVVSVRFSQVESSGVKDNIRDILTNSYDERFLKMIVKDPSSQQVLGQDD